MKKLLSLICAFALMLALTPLALAAEKTYTEDGVTYIYTVENSEVTIRKADINNALIVTIPNQIDGCSVCAIYENCFRGNYDVTEINIPSSVRSIGESAFDNCHSLVEMSLPSGLESIGDCAFSACVSLVKVNIPAGITNNINNVLKGDLNLKEVIFEGETEDKFTVLSDAVYSSMEADLSPARIKANEDVKVETDGEIMEFTGACPYIDANGRTQMPVRALSEKLGYAVEWDENARKITITKGNEQCKFKIENRIAFASDNRVAIMNTAPVIVDDYTYVPLRYFFEMLNKNVKWDGETNTVNIIE